MYAASASDKRRNRPGCALLVARTLDDVSLHRRGLAPAVETRLDRGFNRDDSLLLTQTCSPYAPDPVEGESARMVDARPPVIGVPQPVTGSHPGAAR